MHKKLFLILALSAPFINAESEGPHGDLGTPSHHEATGDPDHWGRCNQCHQEMGIPELPQFTKNQSKWREEIHSTDDKRRKLARGWLKKFFNVMVDRKVMPPADSDFARDPKFQKPTEEMAEFVKAEHEKIFTVSTKKPVAPEKVKKSEKTVKTPKNKVAHVLSAEKRELYKKMLPKIDNEWLSAILNDPDTVFYDDASMPSVYQDPVPPAKGVLRTDSDAAKSRYEVIDETGKFKFPFGDGVGLDSASRAKVFHAIHLPKKENGEIWPIAHFKKVNKPAWNQQMEMGNTWDMIFPEGTTTFEEVFHNGPDNLSRAVQLRTRTKQGKEWKPDVFKPFPTAESLAVALEKIKAEDPEFAKKTKVDELITFARDNTTIKKDVLKKQALGNVFKGGGAKDELPPIDPELTVRLLKNTPFVSSIGKVWKKNGDLVCNDPTTNQDFSIVPKGFTSHHVSVTTKDCNQCHRHTNQPLTYFFKQSDHVEAHLSAYGNMWGMDGVFTFHPFDLSTLDDYAKNGNRENRQFRSEFIKSGMIEAFDKSRFPADRYQRSN